MRLASPRLLCGARVRLLCCDAQILADATAKRQEITDLKDENTALKDAVRAWQAALLPLQHLPVENSRLSAQVAQVRDR